MKTKPFFRTNTPLQLKSFSQGTSKSAKRRREAQRQVYYDAKNGDVVQTSNGRRYRVDGNGTWRVE